MKVFYCYIKRTKSRQYGIKKPMNIKAVAAGEDVKGHNNKQKS